MIERQAPSAVAESAGSPAGAGGHAFSQWLRAQLKARKLTQRQLARKSGIDHSTISRLIGGNRVPSLRTANLLARSLGVPVGPDGVGRAGLGSDEPPAARVEYALRLDDRLSEAQVREIMNVYLAVRWRRRR
jgi:transcriptional regulator with XRE-family HTH domain